MNELEYFPIQLPGRKAYSNDVMIRQFGKDEVAHYDRLRRNGNEANVRALIGNTIQGESVDNLYEPDFLFAMMWHRVNSFLNFPMKLPWTCPECGGENSDQLDLARIMSEDLSEDYDPEGNTFDFPCGLPITLRLPKMGDEARARRLLTRGLGVQRIDEETLRKGETVMMMEPDDNYTEPEKWKIVNDAFTVQDTFLIEGFKREFAFGPSTRQMCNCSQCGGQQNVGFRFSLLEFLPSDYDSGSIRTRILHDRPTRATAQRAKDALFPKSTLAAATAPEKTRRPGPGTQPLARRAGGDESADAGSSPSGAMTGGAMTGGAINAAERVRAGSGPILPNASGRLMEESRSPAPMDSRGDNRGAGSDEPAPIVSREMTGAEVIRDR
jgi:hypothetical protein